MKFKREPGKALLVKDMLYVPRLQKNLISVSILEDKGFEVTFRDGKFISILRDLASIQ